MTPRGLLMLQRLRNLGVQPTVRVWVDVGFGPDQSVGDGAAHVDAVVAPWERIAELDWRELAAADVEVVSERESDRYGAILLAISEAKPARLIGTVLNASAPVERVREVFA